MSDNIYKNNVYSKNEQMWHRKGRVGTGDETAEQVYSQMENVLFERHPFALTVLNQQIKNNVFGIIRIEGNKVKLVGTTKDHYNLLQPIEYIRKFDSVIGKPCETLGFLGSNADKLFITWILPKIDIHGDIMKLFGLLSFGFDGKYGNHLFATGVRTICENTHAMAVNDASENNNYGFGTNSNGAIVTARHNQKNHLEVLGYWMKFVDQESERQAEMLKGLFCKMEEKPLTIDDAYGFFAKVHPYPDDKRTFIPPELVEQEETNYDDKKEKADESRELLMSLFGGQGIAINKTVFGAYNCVTEMQNYHIMAKKNDGVDSIIMGSRAKVMDKAFAVAKDYISQ
jgi:hypothetical protein